MIIHSTENTTGHTCRVRVEGIDRGTPDTLVRLFAQGAAGAHNKGYVIPASSPVQWCDEFGRPLADGSDTTDATVARVLCEVTEP